MSQLILASGSPRRRELLGLLGIPFRVMPADVDETPAFGEAPEAYARRLSLDKARAVAGDLSEGIVLAADTIVVVHGRILGKPADASEAAEMLSALAGRVHRVITAVAVLRRPDGAWIEECCETRVLMRSYTGSEMNAYIGGGDPFDKAGAYAIQHAEFHPVERLDGCYTNVVGLPLCRVKAALSALGMVLAQRPERCLATALPPCDFTPAGLRGGEGH